MENNELITKALNYIKRETQKSEITIDEVASHAGFSTDYFNRIFLLHTGFNVMEYVRFTRLKKASLLLRTTSRDILDIALECGYEAHESFTRAFKRQYGKVPSEYRRFFADKPIKYADATDNVAVMRFLHEFPEFEHRDSDEVIDALLEKNAKKHGISAIVMYDYNGTRFVSDSKESCIGIDEFQKGGCYAEALSDSINEIIRIYNKIKDYVSEFAFYSELAKQEVKAVFERERVNCKSVNKEVTQYLYTGDRKNVFLDGLSVKALTIRDIKDIKRFAAKYGHDWKIEESLTQRDVYNNAPYELPFGIFKGDEIIGVCRAAVYELRGFRVGDIEGACILDEYKKEDICDYIYSTVINELLARNYLPFVSYLNNSEKSVTDISPERYGFEAVKNIYSVIK